MQCFKINKQSSKCMILLECLTDHLVPESSPTPSHSPKPRMRIIMFVCGQPSDVYTMYIYIYISIGPSLTIAIIYGLPFDVYQLGRLRRLIFLVWTTLRSFFLDNPPKPFSLDSSHALTHTVLGCPSAYGMHDANSIQLYNTFKYINMHIFT